MITLFDHQVEALNHIKRCESEGPLRGGILHLQQGMGKTSTILSLINGEKEEKKKTLVVCAKTILKEWKEEKEKFFPEMKMLIYHRDFTKKYDDLDVDTVDSYDVIVTTYDVIMSIDRNNGYSESICIIGDHGIHNGKIIGFKQKTQPDPEETGSNLLFGYPWYRMVTDESQKFTNTKTKTFKAICGLYSKYRWCLTGTPIRNNDKDLWALLFFCGMTSPSNPKHFAMSDFSDYKQVVLSKDLTESKINVPALIRHTDYIDFTDNELQIYRYFLIDLWTSYRRLVDGEGDKRFATILSLFTRLRQICISPFLITSESKRGRLKEDTELAKDHKELEEYVHTVKISSKINKILEIVESIPKDDKIVIFSSFVSCLDLLRNTLTDKFNVLQIDGSVPIEKRWNILNLFKQSSDHRILFANFKVGAEGLNLPEANHVICVEGWWSPTLTDQAISRCHRMGQTKPVHSYKIILSKSIEEIIDEICTAKGSIAHAYFKGKVDERKKVPTVDKETLGKILSAALNQF